ncbi:MAG TPA: hypothetical protein EYN31_02265 [Candidatus Marinimicrobia bacterium]|nr:hypothetical protein [Candidatus Neomarinimicrobiota bacterium]
MPYIAQKQIMFMKNKIVQSGQADGSTGVKMSAEVNQQEDWRNFNDRVCRRKKNRETKTMTTREEYYLKRKISRQKRQLEGLQKELKNPAGIKEGVLTDREKMVLHFCCSMTIAKVTGMSHSAGTIEKMVEDIRKNRCRSLSTEDVAALLHDINEEMIAGTIMMEEMMEDTKWSMTGERPNKRFGTDWRDMK